MDLRTILTNIWYVLVLPGGLLVVLWQLITGQLF